jgi:choline dehydrogenase
MSQTSEQATDVLIVGGGSAGSVLATRLTQDLSRTVRLLEAGTVYPLDSIPSDLLDPAHVVGEPEHDWGFMMRGNARSPEIIAPRGKVLGGSSSVNATVAMRITPDDIRKWNVHDLEGWSVEDIAATFKAMENAPEGDASIHGRVGRFPVRQETYEGLTTSLKAFVDAGVAAGYKRVEDFNSEERHGIGGNPVNVVDNHRQSTAMVYLTQEVRDRANLFLHGGVLVDRVFVTDGRAVGVIDADGTFYEADEVILCAGAYVSPAILMRSGIGPAAHLEQLGIDLVADLPVGERLTEQPFYYNAYALKPDYQDERPATGGLLWIASSEAKGEELDLHITATHLLPPEYSPTGGAVTFGVAVVAPDSHGTIRLRSRDPREQPVIDGNYLYEERDRRRLLEAVKIGRRLGSSPQMSPLIALEMFPGPDVQDDDALLRVIEANLASYGHPAATAPMGGANDPAAVVDSTGAVKGIERLRVIDASIMPELPTVATNPTVIMIAEHLANRVYGAATAPAGAAGSDAPEHLARAVTSI